jgi:hypothetical protein
MKYLPLIPSQSFRFVHLFEEHAFSFRVFWSVENEAWYLDVVCETLNYAFKGFALVTGLDMFTGTPAEYLGSLTLIDLEGEEDPSFDRIGDRWKLVFVSQTEREVLLDT